MKILINLLTFQSSGINSPSFRGKKEIDRSTCEKSRKIKTAKKDRQIKN